MKVCPVCGKEYSDTSTLCPIDAGVLQHDEDPLIGKTLAGKYLIEDLIKHGGMGAVYRGKHVLMEKTVAIKVLRPSLASDNDVVARFSREAKAASRISHPHAVSVTDFGEDEHGVVFLVMEYLDGRTLKEIIRSEGPLALGRTVEIVRQVAGALDAAHQQGVIHRDLKSDNIMLSQTNGGDWAKVLDFGIAKIQQPHGVADPDITAANLVVGTPQYMSPEQCAQSGPLDARSDIYSFGIILYEMLAGRVPFTGDSPTVIMMQQVQDPPPSVLEARPDLPVAVAGVVMRALAKQPSERFQSAGEFSAALAEGVAGAASAPVVAAPETTPNAVVEVIDDDEATLVHPRTVDEITSVQPRRVEPVYVEPLIEEAPLPSVNPWRIMIPAAIVLVAVFGVVFLLTRGSGQTSVTNVNGNVNANQSVLSADPNSQPVQPLGTPTGVVESNIQPQPSTIPTPKPANVNAEPASVVGDFGANENSNAPRNRNANVKTTPTPRSTPSNDEPPPPPPRATPTLAAKPKATPTPLN
jgi:eukaryotic-like serine/threonine-protein kinase